VVVYTKTAKMIKMSFALRT